MKRFRTILEEIILGKSLIEKMIFVFKNTMFMEKYMSKVAEFSLHEMLLFNEYRQGKKPVLTHSLAFPKTSLEEEAIETANRYLKRKS